MTRWSLRNVLMPVSHQEFVTYIKQFKQAAEQSFDTECKLEITALAAPKAYTTFWDNALQSEINSINEENTILKTDALSDITSSLWATAKYVEVLINPVDKTKAPRAALAHAEFKGEKPRQAKFYIQPNGEDAREQMLSQQSGKIVGDGFESNGTRSACLPESLGKTIAWPHPKKLTP